MASAAYLHASAANGGARPGADRRDFQGSCITLGLTHTLRGEQ